MVRPAGEDFGGGSTAVEIINQPIIEQVSTTSVKVNVTIVNMTSQPTSYKFYWYKYNTSTLVFDLVSSQTNSSIPYTITALTEGALYKFTVEAYLNATVSQSRSTLHTMVGSSINGQVISPIPKTLNAPNTGG